MHLLKCYQKVNNSYCHKSLLGENYKIKLRNHLCLQSVAVQGGPIRTFLRYHIFAATTDIIMQFLLKCSEITAEKDK